MQDSLPALVLPVHKPKDITSFDVIRKLKRKLPKGWKKIGHFGTLDPFATGILLVGVNSALRANNYLQEFAPKTYKATGVLGVQTDSGDNTGKVIKEEPVEISHSQQEVQEILESFVGEYWQSPPYYSAAKHEGKPLYEWARSGVFIDKPQVQREIYSIKLTNIEKDKIDFEVTVSTGTYIRKLVEDIALKLGTIAHLSYLERTKIGHITTEDLLPVSLWDTPGREVEFWLENSKAVDSLIELNHAILSDSLKYKNGIPAQIQDYNLSNSANALSRDLVWVYSDQNSLLGLGQIQADGSIKSQFNLPTN